MITPEIPPKCGGIGYYVYYLSKELIKMGLDVSVILRGKQDRSFLHGDLRVEEIKVPGRPPFNLPIFKKRVEKILSKETPDLVHVHSSSMPAISGGCPVLVTAHLCMKEGIPAFYRPVRDLDALYRNIVFFFYIRVEKQLSRSCDKITVVSNSLREEFRKHYNVDSAVIYNGVDPDKFKENSLPKEDWVLFTGMFRIGKGIVDLLDVAELLRGSHPKVKLIMVGDGPLKNRIQRAIEKRNLINVKTRSHLSHSELLEYYQRSRIYVLPSYYEGLSTTILEAMACQLPVVASNVYGIPELVEEGVTGYMVNPGDIKGFYSRIVELIEDSEKQTIFGEEGRKKVLKNFTWSHVAQGVIREYRDLLYYKEIRTIKNA